MPTDEQAKQYVAGIFDRASETYDQTGVDYFGALGRLVASAAQLRPGERVLDVGSGRGAVLLPAAEAVGSLGSVDGVDLAPGMVTRLSADLDRLGCDNATVVLGDAQDPPVQGPYDVVVSGMVLFFLPDPTVAVRRYRELLRPGGRLAYSTLAMDDARWNAVYASVAPFLPEGMPQRRSTQSTGPFSSDDAGTTMLEDAGFHDVRHVHHGNVTTFVSKDEWWAWSWSHGMRVIWERVPPESVEQVRSVVYEAIDGIRDPDGGISIRQTIRVTTAHT